MDKANNPDVTIISLPAQEGQPTAKINAVAPGSRNPLNRAVLAEIVDLAKQCRYRNCSHTIETGCAVIRAVENGDLDSKRYSSYLKLRRESDHYGMTYLEKRRKDKNFGKMVKQIMKDKKKFKED